MELNSSVNTFIGGMNLDSDISLLKENQYIYAENIRLLANEDSTTGVLQNRDCLKKWEKSFLNNPNEQILGTVVTRIFDPTINTSRECIVVVTYYIDIIIYNNIYIIYIDENKDEWVEIKHLIKDAQIGWSSKLKIVANYESDTVSKIYVCDGIHHIKIIDLTKDYTDQVFDKDSFDIAPISNMTPPTLHKIVDGQLQVGAIQYAYLLFSKHGAESSISQVSELINIPKKYSLDSTLYVSGGNEGETSNMGCLIMITFSESTEFDMFRLYRIRYDKNNSISEVYIVTEFQIPDDNKIIYSDTQDTFLSEITVDEFNMLTLTEFSPKIIEKHDNRLFAAGIAEDTWDAGEYDARAYRCDSTGYIELRHSNIQDNITGKLDETGKIDGVDVPKEHDCINPSNTVMWGDEANTYIYGVKGDNRFIGGTGPNISYEFCFTDVVCSDIEPMYSNYVLQTIPSVSLDLKSEYVNTKKILVKDIDDNTVYSHWIDNTDGVMLNYADSYFTSNFLGYQRDEIYRFGIVFYNKKDQKTPVYWIGDIRMPSQVTISDINSPFFPFHFNASVPKSDVVSGLPGTNTKLIELLGKAIGIHFTVNNIPEGAVKWEIVRCPRTELDRTIVSQGVLNSLVHFDTWGDTTKDLGDSDIRPTSILNFGKQYNVVRTIMSKYQFDVLDDYVEFISPEICVSGQSMLDNLKNQNICFLNWLYSRFPPETEGSWGDTDYISQGSFVAVRQSDVYTNVTDKSPAETGGSSGGLYAIEGDNKMYVHFGAIDELSGGGDYGNALLFKPYKTLLPDYQYTNSWKNSHRIKNAIISNILPRVGSIEDAKQYAQPIGDKNYINTSVAAKDSINNHGMCAVFLMDLSQGFTVGTNNETNDIWYGNTPVVNIKLQKYPYNGNTYTSRTNSTYISCAQHVSYTSKDVYVFGGDTYLGVFDYTHTTMRQVNNDPSKDATHQLYVNCYIPLESTVNLNLFNSDTYSKTVNGDIALNLIQYEPFVSAAYTQTKPLYEYNSAYSVDGNAQVFVPELLYSDLDSTYETRITCSELKTNNELVDSWTKFKFANYLDVDNQYGPVTNLKSFGGKLFFWQDSAVGVASVNERSLILDNNIAQLTLGTGGILVRYDYYTTLNGSWKVNDKSICNSASTLYWYDTDKHEICAINNTVIELSKVKGVKSWCNKLLGRTDTIGWYDWKYNEVLFQNKSEDTKRSIVFNEQLNVFTGFYTYPVEEVAQMVNNIITLDIFGNIYLHNSDINYEPFKSKIKYVINKGYPETKVFDNVWFDAELNDDVISSIIFSTKTQETNPINFEDIENREDTYRFPIPRDKNGVARMRGKYLICDYTFDCKNDGDFKIPYVKTTFRISRV